jgi:hypothetical protein
MKDYFKPKHNEPRHNEPRHNELDGEPLCCEKEVAIATALRNGPLDRDLRDHISVCQVCSEVLVVVQELGRDAANELDLPQVPDAGLIWRRAQDRVITQAIRKATLPIRVVRACAFGAAVLSAPWLLIELRRIPGWMPRFSLEWLSMDVSSTVLKEMTVIGLAATLICVGLSSWYVLREE